MRILATIVIALVMTVSATAAEKNIKDTLAESFPNFKAETITKTAIKDVYEVATGGNIIYFHPSGYLFFGEIFGKDGKNITAERREELTSKKFKDIPIEKAIKIGSGKNTVIEFADPDCPYCRKASQHISKKEDITRYVFLIPLRQIHPDAEKKIKYILCSTDQGKAYEDVFAGKMDKKDLSITMKGCDEKATAKIKELEEVATKLGVTGTPVFWVNNKYVSGANLAAIDSALSGGK